MGLNRINDVLRTAKTEMLERASAGEEYVVDGKRGVWRDVSGNAVFFPDDGGAPVGMPQALKGKAKEGDGDGDGDGGGGGYEQPDTSGQEIVKAKTKIKKLKGQRKKLSKANSGSGSEAVSDIEDNGSDEDKESIDDLRNNRDVPPSRMKALASNGVRKAAIIGVGAALSLAFPGLLGMALTLLLVDRAIGSVARKVMGEAKTSKLDKLTSDIESSIETALDSLLSGEVDDDELSAALEKARKQKAKKKV